MLSPELYHKIIRFNKITTLDNNTIINRLDSNNWNLLLTSKLGIDKPVLRSILKTESKKADLKKAEREKAEHEKAEREKAEHEKTKSEKIKHDTIKKMDAIF